MFDFTLKVIKESLKDRQILVYTFILPSIAMLLIGFVITTMGATDTVKVGIVNEDRGLMNTTASAAIVQEFQGQGNLSLVYLSRDQLDQAFKDREIDGAVVFGSTFTSDLITKKSADLKIVSEGTDQAKGMAISQATIGAATRAAGKMQKDPVKAPINLVSERYYGTGLTAKEFAVASIIGLISFVMPCLLTLTAVLSRKGRDCRSPEAPGPLGRAITYVSVFGLLGFVQVLTIMAYVLWYVNASFVGDAATVAFIQLLIALAGVAVGLLIASLASDYLQAFTLVIPAVVLQMLFGGLMVPISKFPWYAQWLSAVLPFTYASEAVKNIIIRGLTLGDVWSDCTALIIIAAAAVLLAIPPLGRQKAEVRVSPVAKAE